MYHFFLGYPNVAVQLEIILFIQTFMKIYEE